MKNILLILILTVGLWSCNKDNGDTIPSMSNLDDATVEILEHTNDFSFELLKNVIQTDTENVNIFISPLSVSLALAMTYNGAETDTKTAFEQLLGYQVMSRADINESYKSFLNLLLNLDSDVTMEIANSIWYRQEFSVVQDFIDINTNTFNAGIMPADFNDPSTLDNINQWIEDNTNGKIQDMLDYIPATAFMYLINAIYFNGTWKYAFDETETQEKPFYPLEIDAISGPNSVLCMRQQSTFNFQKNDLFSAVEMPYGDGDYSMVVLLPANGHTTGDILESLTSENWKTWMGAFEETENVQVQIPKLKIEYGTKLLNVELTKMGLGIAFSETDADFSGIRELNDIYISRVLHKTFLDMNEAGTEAAAATIVEMCFEGPISGDVEEITYFLVDKPYLIFIKEKETNTILFAGKIKNPGV